MLWFSEMESEENMETEDVNVERDCDEEINCDQLQTLGGARHFDMERY